LKSGSANPASPVWPAYFYSGRVWVDWCSKEGTDSIETSVEKAVGFLTSQFAQGKRYCTLNTDGTSCSATCIPVDKRKASSDFHTDKGHCHLHSPQPKYTGHWDVTKVLQGFAFKHLTYKVAVLMMLANADRDRASDLAAQLACM